MMCPYDSWGLGGTNPSSIALSGILIIDNPGGFTVGVDCQWTLWKGKLFTMHVHQLPLQDMPAARPLPPKTK